MTLDFDIRKSFVINILNHSKKLDFGSFTKLFFLSVIIIFLGTSFSEAAKKKDEKDCKYCEKYETLADWPESERPEAFIYEEFDYPEGMFTPKQDDSKKRQGAAGKLNYLSKHIKLFADGAMYSQNMVMRDGYLDNHQGSWLMSLDTFENLFKIFWDDGYQIHIHQNGDAGLDRLLATLKKNLDDNPRADHRTTVVHFGYSAKDQLEKMKELGVVVSANPYYVTALSDLYSRKGVGYERSQEMVRLGDAIKEGIKVALHSDMPMAPASPLMLMHAAVNRDNFAGKVAGPNQRISKIEALRAVTINAAYVLRLEKMYGSIEIGKYANFTVLNRNPLIINSNEIKNIKILGTVLKGDSLPVN